MDHCYNCGCQPSVVAAPAIPAHGRLKLKERELKASPSHRGIKQTNQKKRGGKKIRMSMSQDLCFLWAI